MGKRWAWAATAWLLFGVGLCVASLNGVPPTLVLERSRAAAGELVDSVREAADNARSSAQGESASGSLASEQTDPVPADPRSTADPRPTDAPDDMSGENGDDPEQRTDTTDGPSEPDEPDEPEEAGGSEPAAVDDQPDGQSDSEQPADSEQPEQPADSEELDDASAPADHEGLDGPDSEDGPGSESEGTGASADAGSGKDPPDELAFMEQDGLLATWDLTEGDDVLLLGYKNEADFELSLPLGWTANGAGVLSGRVVVSGQARDDASLRVDVEGRPVATWAAGDDPTLNAPVPLPNPEVSTDQSVSVDFETTTPLTADGACADPSHVARWFEVEQPAVVGYIRPLDLNVARAIRGIGTVSRVTGEPIIVSTNGRPSEALRETVGNLVSAIGHYGVPSGWKIGFDDGESGAVEGTRLKIVEDPTEDGRISVRVVDDRPLIEVVGKASDLLKITEALSDPDRIDYFHYTRVSADGIPDEANYPLAEVFPFRDLGYSDRTLRGLGPQSLVYRVHIPAGVPPDAATLALYATHSPSLGKAESTVSIRINGSREEILAVANETGELEVLHTIRPADLRPGLNFVTINTQLVASSFGENACGASAGSAWLTVSDISALGVERTSELQAPRLGVEDARFALATPVDFNTTDVAIPDQYGPADLELAAGVIAELSNRAEGGSPRLVVDSDVDRTRHLVVVGADMNRELLESVPKATSRGSAVNELAIAAQGLGMVAAQPSPYETGRVMLAFTGATREGAARGAAAAMSAAVNDVTTHFALVSPDTIRPIHNGDTRFDGVTVDEVPLDDLPYSDSISGSFDVPEGEAYEDWILEQANRIEAARQPERDRRRLVAIGLLVVVCIIAGLWWVDRTRRKDAAGGH